MHWLSKLDFEKVYFQSRQEVSTINCENEGLCQQDSYLKEKEIALKFKHHSGKMCQPRRWKQWCWSSCCLESPGGHSWHWTRKDCKRFSPKVRVDQQIISIYIPIAYYPQFISYLSSEIPKKKLHHTKHHRTSQRPPAPATPRPPPCHRQPARPPAPPRPGRPPRSPTSCAPPGTPWRGCCPSA